MSGNIQPGIILKTIQKRSFERIICGFYKIFLYQATVKEVTLKIIKPEIIRKLININAAMIVIKGGHDPLSSE